MKTRKKQVKAQLMWADPRPPKSNPIIALSRERVYPDDVPVAVLRIDDPEVLIQIAAAAQLSVCKKYFPGWNPTAEEIARCKEYASAGLAALGILSKNRAKKGTK